MPATIGSTRTAPPPPSSQPPPYAGRASTILPPVLGAGSADGGRPQSTVPAHGSSVKSGRAATRAMKAPSAPRANSAPRPGPPPPPTNA
jgi:hypothetical protein